MSIKTFRASDLAVEIDTETNGVKVLVGDHLLWSRAGQKWTTEPPTEPGCWWWAMQADHTKPSLVWIEVAAVTTTYGVERGKLVATDCFHPHYVPFKKITHWQRIPTPEPPK